MLACSQSFRWSEKRRRILTSSDTPKFVDVANGDHTKNVDVLDTRTSVCLLTEFLIATSIFVLYDYTVHGCE